jgi:hypothetical protein
MPFDARNFGRPGGGPFDDLLTNQPGYRLHGESTRPTTQNSPLFGMDGAEWRGFFFALTGLLGLVLGLSALVISALGR